MLYFVLQNSTKDTENDQQIRNNALLSALSSFDECKMIHTEPEMFIVCIYLPKASEPLIPTNVRPLTTLVPFVS